MTNKTVKYLGMMKPMTGGDAALWKLTARRFEQIGIGAECYPHSPEHLRELINYLPSAAVNTAHLPYHLDITLPEHREMVVEFARVANGELRGFTLHDQSSYTPERGGEFDNALQNLTAALKAVAPVALFFEYVSTRDTDEFDRLASFAAEFPNVYPCLDVGHFAVDYCRDNLRRTCPDLQLKDLSPHFKLLEKYIERIQDAVHTALTQTLELVKKFLRPEFAKLHFHAHDTHPLSKLSPYPIRDHLSFLQQISLPFAFAGSNLVSCTWGIAGARALRELIESAKMDISLMLEIHAQPGLLPLKEDADIFAHWEDLTNAQVHNYHLELIRQSYCALTS